MWLIAVVAAAPCQCFSPGASRPALPQAVHQLDDIPKRAADPVQLPNHEGVALPRHVQGAGKVGRLVTVPEQVSS